MFDPVLRKLPALFNVFTLIRVRHITRRSKSMDKASLMAKSGRITVARLKSS